MEQARALGADHVIDYTQQDFTRSSERYDLILAVNGARSILDYRRALAPQGRYAMVGGGSKQLFQALLFGPLLSLGRRKMAAVSAKANVQDLRLLKELVEAGKLRPVIDRRFPLERTADAVRYVQQGHASGKVVVVI
jgi:NADPH:quinone reductase-like Zn-dependent oxidoreductase